VVTSPPYNVSKIYDNDLSLDEYLNLLRDTFEEIYHKLVDGGRVCLNIANIGRKPYIPLSDYISRIMIELGYIHRGEIIWDKGASAGASTAWGSWQSATNPFLRDVHEYILVFSKSTLKRSKHGKSNTISKEEFLEYTKSVWTFETASARRIGHPAPFPTELPYRCIQLYSLSDDMIFDPFAGSGQTAIAALKSGRRFFGMDIEEDYVYLAQDRIENYRLGIFEE
jgi:site-specific DNA-methyltransferase (adenine-specific)